MHDQMGQNMFLKYGILTNVYQLKTIFEEYFKVSESILPLKIFLSVSKQKKTNYVFVSLPTPVYKTAHNFE